jgi:Ca-activated chloride channel family protein
MFKVILIFFIFSFQSFAGLLDFVDFDNAKTAYENKEFSKSAKIYQRFDDDFSKLNYANSLYKQAKYQEALGQYKSIKNENLTFDSLYNSGNAYNKLEEYDEAIKSYEKALKIKKDTDTISNLEIAKKGKKRKKQQQKNKNNKSQNNKKSQDKKQQQNKKNSNKNKNTKKSKEQQQAEQRKKLDRLEQKKWEKSLRKPIQTLMIPIDKKGKNNENNNNPW